MFMGSNDIPNEELASGIRDLLQRVSGDSSDDRSNDGLRGGERQMKS